MGDYRRGIGTGDNNKLCWVVAFDPGETTGWCTMGIKPENLDGRGEKYSGITDHKTLQDCLAYINYGQIDCVASGGFEDTATKHAGISFGPEALGVAKMAQMCWSLPDPAIVVEDFIIDFSKIDQARHTLSPVRIMSMLSYALYIENEQPFYSKLFVQNRSMAKTTCTDDRLRRWGLYDSSGGRHARDATRHAFYFLRTCRGNGAKAKENRFKAWPDKFNDPWDRREPEDSLTRPKKTRKKKQGERVRFV